MAESKRKASHVTKPLEDDESQKKRDRIILIVFFSAMVAIVIGMIFLSRFLSGN